MFHFLDSQPHLLPKHTYNYMKLETAQLETAATRNHFERKTNHQFLRLSALSPLAEQQVCADANYEPAGHP